MVAAQLLKSGANRESDVPTSSLSHKTMGKAKVSAYISRAWLIPLSKSSRLVTDSNPNTITAVGEQSVFTAGISKKSSETMVLCRAVVEGER